MEILRKRHVRFFNRWLTALPTSAASYMDKQPLIAFFSICGLDLLDDLPEDRSTLINWLYSMQYVDEEESIGGFLGGFIIGRDANEQQCWLDIPSLGLTYTALASLVTLGDDLSRVKRAEILKGLNKLQLEDGSFASQWLDGEIDMRFVYCAVCVAYMLNDFSTINIDACVHFILDCFTYEGGVACVPGCEAHGGSTYCAIASLALLDRLDAIGDRQNQLVQWCLFRQDKKGFNGRPNKVEDTCYSFWIGGTLRILKAFQHSSATLNRDFLLSAQNPITGGLGKYDASAPDPHHTYLGLAGLSFIEKDTLREVHVPLNISARAHDALKSIHATW
ncbi:geranylgeranyl transferase type-1 subunit beta-like isoform X1 [Varroa jacobsoni]|uniref:Prenyltransferase alpha-alpha toroid domain-containing protein n=2 Tax=Varroa TaxID=62624 RepID=A0A7M7KGX3_VARDE|nr:geranylgeranyl transferase type-1 subunit beta-like isoform X1 [Varroa destructor]XP_022704559.1 geranylgeranyl transferase type-1 subunit beta-like isoform X1 [Varroa jacobsoni]